MRHQRDLVPPETRDLQRELAETRQALVYQRQRTAEAERQVAALLDAQARGWRVSLMCARPTGQSSPEAPADAPLATASAPLANR